MSSAHVDVVKDVHFYLFNFITIFMAILIFSSTCSYLIVIVLLLGPPNDVFMGGLAMSAVYCGVCGCSLEWNRFMSLGLAGLWGCLRVLVLLCDWITNHLTKNF